MKACLDASVILPSLIEEAASTVVDTFVRSATDPLLISDCAAAEVASGLSRLVRTGRLDAQDARACLADFDAWRATATAEFDFISADFRLGHIFVRRFELMLRAPDALHAAACRRGGHRLVTLDRRLANAAGQLGVSVHLLS